MSPENIQFLTEAEKTVKKTGIPGLYVIDRPVYKDPRGFFHEIVRFDHLQAVSGIDFKPVQANHSRSLPGVIRAIHAECWNKLVYPVSGKMYAAIVDIRPESPTFGKFEEFVFDTSCEHKALFVPNGLGNSICVIGSEPVDYIYLVDAYYKGDAPRAVAWNDPDLNINWPISNPIISDKDQRNSTLRELFPEKFK
jgi:dTDP-4-dehydrorhamnose 3,5-epimerase